MTFARADLLWVGPLVAAALALALGVQSRRLARLRSALGDVAARRLVPVEPGRMTARLASLLLAAFALGLAISGPVPVDPEPPEAPAPLDLAIAVDLSRSMTADDVAPSRLARARDVVVELTEALPSARIALVVFAEWPYSLVPLTDDAEVVRYFARSLRAEVVSDRHQGTSLASALAVARAALDARPRAGARRAILVLSDGGSHEGRAAVLEAAELASESGVGVWAGGLGTARGAELGTVVAPVLDARGAPVVAALEEDLLRAVATAGGGRYEDVADEGGVGALAASLGESAGSSATTTPRDLDAALWLTLLALPLLLWEGALDGGRGLLRLRAAPGGRRG
jgi:Ca-activated chloride channel family protein